MASRPADVLLAALKKDNPDLSEYPEVFLVATSELLAEALEGAPKRVRQMAFNLPRNHGLRQQLLRGELTPRALCGMDVADMATDAIKSQRAAIADRAKASILNASTLSLGTFTRDVRCPECTHREARFLHESNSDSREWHGRKNEIWGAKHCEDESAGLCTITCTACGHTWRSGETPLACDEPDPDPPPPPAQRVCILGWKGSLRD
jgi:DNA-directed RNA polymerase subunit M/transcription elongation factor TFIIS